MSELMSGSRVSNGASVFEFGPFRADRDQRVLRRLEEVIPLAPKAFDVLTELARSAGRTRTRDELMASVWGDVTVEEANLTQTISVLRKALGDTAEKPVYIVTVPRHGYRFGVPVREISAEQADTGPRINGNAAESDTGEKATGSSVRLLGEAAILVVTLLIAAWQSWSAPSSNQIRSIAVLPFQNLSTDSTQEHLAISTTEALISALCQTGVFEKVVSRTTATDFKDTRKTTPEIGRELGADAIIEGSVQRVAGRTRIRTQLVFAAQDRLLWAQTYDREGEDLLALESEIARTIAQEIRTRARTATIH